MTPARQAFFPLDKRWRLNESRYSDRVSADIVWLAGVESSYAQAQQVMARMGHREVPTTSFWRRTQRAGERLKAHVEQAQAQVALERVVLPPPGADHHQVKGVSLDGGMVNIREEGWKEFKVGTVYDVVMQPAQDPQTGEDSELPRGVNVHYAAVLGEVRRFMPALWALAVSQGIPTAARSSVTADGAEWIWMLVADLFPDSIQIVDWFHALTHLAEASHALYPAEGERAERWYKQMRTSLYEGAVWRIIQALERDGLGEQARYFRTHQRRMQYQEFREEGYPIGSGTVESGCKQYKARITGPGMRWGRPGLDRMLVIRSAVMSGSFQSLWAAA